MDLCRHIHKLFLMLFMLWSPIAQLSGSESCFDTRLFTEPNKLLFFKKKNWISCIKTDVCKHLSINYEKILAIEELSWDKVIREKMCFYIDKWFQCALLFTLKTFDWRLGTFESNLCLQTLTSLRLWFNGSIVIDV